MCWDAHNKQRTLKCKRFSREKSSWATTQQAKSQHKNWHLKHPFPNNILHRYWKKTTCTRDCRLGHDWATSLTHSHAHIYKRKVYMMLNQFCSCSKNWRFTVILLGSMYAQNTKTTNCFSQTFEQRKLVKHAGWSKQLYDHPGKEVNSALMHKWKKSGSAICVWWNRLDKGENVFYNEYFSSGIWITKLKSLQYTQIHLPDLKVSDSAKKGETYSHVNVPLIPSRGLISVILKWVLQELKG